MFLGGLNNPRWKLEKSILRKQRRVQMITSLSEWKRGVKRTKKEVQSATCLGLPVSGRNRSGDRETSFSEGEAARYESRKH